MDNRNEYSNTKVHSLGKEDLEKALDQMIKKTASAWRTPKVSNVKWEDLSKLEYEKKSILDTVQLPLVHQELVEQDKVKFLVETDTLDGRYEWKFIVIDRKDPTPNQTYKYVVRVNPISIERDEVKQAMKSAKTIVMNVMWGFMPCFWKGTSKMDEVNNKNCYVQKCHGGDDTPQTF